MVSLPSAKMGGAYELAPPSAQLPIPESSHVRSLFPHLLYIFNGGLGLVLISAGQDHSGAPPGQVQSCGLTYAGVSSCNESE